MAMSYNKLTIFLSAASTLGQMTEFQKRN